MKQETKSQKARFNMYMCVESSVRLGNKEVSTFCTKFFTSEDGADLDMSEGRVQGGCSNIKDHGAEGGGQPSMS